MRFTCWRLEESARAEWVVEKIGDVSWRLIVFMHTVSLQRVKRSIDRLTRRSGNTLVLERDLEGILY